MNKMEKSKVKTLLELTESIREREERLGKVKEELDTLQDWINFSKLKKMKVEAELDSLL